MLVSSPYPLHVLRLTSSTRSLSQPELPADIYGLFAEFLAGSCSFAALASLNLVNRIIHNETLPVLYETVLQDTPAVQHCEVAQLIFCGEPIPKRFSFTK